MPNGEVIETSRPVQFLTALEIRDRQGATDAEIRAAIEDLEASR